MAIVAETSGDPATVLKEVEAAAGSIRGDTPAYQARTMDEVVAGQVSARRFAMGLLSGFGLVALVLAAVGVAGVLATMVAERTREIGVRMALGAEPAAMMRQVIRHGLSRAGLGLVLGLVSVRVATRFIASLLYGVEPTDPVTYGAIAVVLLLTGRVAAGIPAWRAARVDPVEALRGD